VRRLFRGHERARETVGQRSAAADFNPERYGQIDGQARDPRRVAEQRIERVEMISERRTRFFEPGEDPSVALVERTVRSADRQARDDLVDQLPLGVVRKRCDNCFLIEDSRSDE